MTESFQEKMRKLIETHCATVRAEAAAVRRCLATLDEPAADPARTIAEGVGHAHKIKGSSGSIGFAEISAIAQALELHLRALDRSGVQPDAEGIARARELGAELDARVENIRPEQSTLFDAA